MTRRRKIAYISGTRADFGLMRSTLKQIAASPALDLGIIVTGMHLDERFGLTVSEIQATGLPIMARIPVSHVSAQGAEVARNIATMLNGMVTALSDLRPDALVVLGDRGEMLAGAIAGGHMSIPVLHIHGGERSGTIDEPVRHAISKLSHFHLVATDESRERLIRMGEAPEAISVVGAPGLDGLEQLAAHDKSTLFIDLGLATDRETALLVYHPVLEEADQAGEQVKTAIEALLATDVAILALMPNSDAGNAEIRAVLESFAAAGQISLVTHLPREQFASMLRHAAMLVGNSSSGIIEAATFGTPVVNIGSRQNLRQRNANVIDAAADSGAILSALRQAQLRGRMATTNAYGDGQTGQRIVSLLETLELPGKLMAKANEY